MRQPVRSRSARAALLLLALPAGCATQNDDGRRAVSTEQASDQAAASSSASWRVSAEPRLRVESSDTIDLADVATVSLLSDGRFVVASGYPPAVRVFTDDGRLERTIGRRGPGPGEFTAIDQVARHGDTVIVVDLEEVAQHFTLDGKLLRTTTRPAGGGRLHGLLASGDRIVGELLTDSVKKGEWTQAPETLTRVLGETRRVLGTFPSQRLTRREDGRLDSDVYAPHNRVVVFPDGFCAGFTGGMDIGCFDDAGTRLGAITLSHRRAVAVTEADREAFFNDVAVANPGAPKAQNDAEVARLRATRTFAKELGFFGRMLPSQDGLLWVGPPSTDAYRFANPNAVPMTETTWSVYTREGVWVAEVTLPARFLPLDAGADHVAGVTRDDADEVVVLVYDLIRP